MRPYCYPSDAWRWSLGFFVRPFHGADKAFRGTKQLVDCASPMDDRPKERAVQADGYPSLSHVLLHDNHSGTTLFPQVEFLFEDDEVPAYIEQAVRVELDKEGRVVAVKSAHPGINIGNFRVSQESDGSDTLHVDGYFPTQYAQSVIFLLYYR